MNILVYVMMGHNLLPPKCFGGLLGRTNTDSLLYLAPNIKNMWRKKKVVTIILLDIASTFPNAIMSQLILNMKWLSYPTPLIKSLKPCWKTGTQLCPSMASHLT